MESMLRQVVHQFLVQSLQEVLRHSTSVIQASVGEGLERVRTQLLNIQAHIKEDVELQIERKWRSGGGSDWGTFRIWLRELAQEQRRRRDQPSPPR